MASHFRSVVLAAIVLSNIRWTSCRLVENQHHHNNTPTSVLQWIEGPWADCSKPCGSGGVTSREVVCLTIIGDGKLFSISPDTECFKQLGPKPEASRECNQDVVCPSWFIGHWGPCDRLCNKGVQRRDVVCHRRREGRVQVLAEDECAEPRPEAERACMERPCAGVAWVASWWMGNDCVSDVCSRSVMCMTEFGVGVEDRFCSHQPRPAELVVCGYTSCDPLWFATQWSKCSVGCGEGEGVQSRKVLCGLPQDLYWSNVTVAVMPESRCEASKRLADTRPCSVTAEPCPESFTSGSPSGEDQKACLDERQSSCEPQWYTTQWSKCSVDCGGREGVQWRKVFCGLLQRDSGEVTELPESRCADSEKAVDTRTCSAPAEQCHEQQFDAPWGECSPADPNDPLQPPPGIGELRRRWMNGRASSLHKLVSDNQDRQFGRAWTFKPCRLDEVVPDDVPQQCAAAPPPPQCALAPAANCSRTRFGCCPDMKTKALGPFDKGCPAPRTCKEAVYGCCPDGLSAAGGPHHEACVRGPCADTLFGCCRSDNQTAARGNCQEGCPQPHQPTSYDEEGCADHMSEAPATETDGDEVTTESTNTDTTMTDMTVSSGAAEETTTRDRTGTTEMTGTTPTSTSLPPLPSLPPQCPGPDNCPEPDRPDVCYLSIDVGTRRRDGPRRRKDIRFAYDSAAGKCRRFRYKGAGGNRNNFLSEQACVDYCRPPPPETVIPAPCTDTLDVETCEEVVRSEICRNRHFSKVCCKSCVEAGELDPPAAA